MNGLCLKILLMIKGTCEINLNMKDNQQICICKNTAIVIPTKLTYSYKYSQDANYIEILFPFASFPEAISQLLPPNNPLTDVVLNKDTSYAIKCTVGDYTRNVLLKYMEAYNVNMCKDSREELIYKQSVLSCILVLLHKQTINYDIVQLGKSQFLIDHVLDYLNLNYKDATLNNMSSHFNMSEAYLSRYIVKHTGKNFIDIVSDVRFNKAIELLSNYSLTEDEIAQTLGFNSIRYFRLFFKKYKGITPSQFRKQVTHNDM